MIKVQFGENVMISKGEKTKLIEELSDVKDDLEENDEFVFSMVYNDEKLYYLVNKEGNIFRVQTRLDEEHVI